MSLRFYMLALPIFALILGLVANFWWFPPVPSEADGRGYFAWQQALLFDHDLDPTKQIQHWSTKDFPVILVPGRHQVMLVNKYPIGWSLTALPVMAPLVAIVRWTGWGGYATPLTGMEPVFGYAVWVIGAVLGAATVFMTDAVLRQWFDPDTSAVATVAAFFGSAAFAYFWRNPFMAHGVAAFWLTASLWAASRYVQHGRFIWLPLCGLAAGMLLLTRSLDILLLPAVAIVLKDRFRKGQRLRWFAGSIVAGLIAIAVLSLQWWVNHQIFGQFNFDPYGANGEHFNWSLQHVPDLLLSTNHGLFLWHPVLILAVLGLGLGTLYSAGPRAASAVAAISVGLVIYAYASWWCWWLGESYGARWSADLMPFWALGLAVWIRTVHGTGRSAYVGVLCLAPLVLVTLTTLILQALQWLLLAEQ